MMKRLTAFALVCVLVASVLCACGPAYADDVAAASLADRVKTAAPAKEGDAYVAASDAYLVAYFSSLDASVVADRAVLQSESQTDFSEVGVFRAASAGDVKAVRKMVEDYLSLMQEYYADFLAMYNAEEVEKIQNASCKVYGTYVVYAFLTKSGQNAFFTAVRQDLVG